MFNEEHELTSTSMLMKPKSAYSFPKPNSSNLLKHIKERHARQAEVPSKPVKERMIIEKVPKPRRNSSLFNLENVLEHLNRYVITLNFKINAF